MKWSPIEDLPSDAERWIGQDYLTERDRWHEARTALQDPALDKTVLHLWTEERHRLFAIETGQIENLYTMRLGMTEMLIAEGFENARSSHTIEEVLADRTLQGLLQDQRDAMEMVFRTVKDERPLSESAIKEWHALLTRHQETAPGRDQRGRRVGIAFLKGAYKRRPNNPKAADGTIHEYCPPEHTPSEMERLIGLHHEHERARRFPAPLEAAWLHHRFVQIHPFEDGNGRTARLLMSYVFARRGEPTPVITALEKPRYFDALQEADRGDLRTFVRMLERKAIEGLESAVYSIRKMLEGRHEYFHMNGNLSASSPGNGWTRHRGSNGRESVIDIGAGGGETPGSVGKKDEKGTPGTCNGPA